MSTILLTGCTHLQQADYPSNWPKIVMKSDFCGQLSGVYDNHAYATDTRNRESLLLAHWLEIDTQELEELKSIDRIRLTCSNNDVIDIQAMINNQVVSNKTVFLKEDGWRIEDGSLYLPIHKDQVAHGSGGAIKSVEFKISMSSDGSLIGEEKTKGMGMAYWLIPIFASQTNLFHWKYMDEK